MIPPTPPAQQDKDIQDILDFLILPSEFECCQIIAQEALDRIVSRPHTSTPKEDPTFTIRACIITSDQVLKDFGLALVKEIEESPETWKRAPITVIGRIIQSLRTPTKEHP
jgi:hypothetical protein